MGSSGEHRRQLQGLNVRWYPDQLSRCRRRARRRRPALRPAWRRLHLGGDWAFRATLGWTLRAARL